jgi:hypothetical protein
MPETPTKSAKRKVLHHSSIVWSQLDVYLYHTFWCILDLNFDLKNEPFIRIFFLLKCFLIVLKQARVCVCVRAYVCDGPAVFCCLCVIAF